MSPEIRPKETTVKEAIEIGRQIAQSIKNAGPYPDEGIKTVTRVVCRELCRAGYNEKQLFAMANTIIDCIIQDSKDRIRNQTG